MSRSPTGSTVVEGFARTGVVSIISRALAKAVLRGAATVAVAPLLVMFWLQERLMGRDRALQSTSEMLALWPGIAGQYLRRAFFSRILDHFDVTATIEFGTVLSKAGARIGQNVYIGPMCHIGLAQIDRDALLAAGVHVPSGPRIHAIADSETPIRDQPGVPGCVHIGADSWIGSAAVVMADVGKHCVIGAGAVVTRDIPDFAVAVGVPARVVRYRNASPATLRNIAEEATIAPQATPERVTAASHISSNERSVLVELREE